MDHHPPTPKFIPDGTKVDDALAVKLGYSGGLILRTAVKKVAKFNTVF